MTITAADHFRAATAHATVAHIADELCSTAPTEAERAYWMGTVRDDAAQAIAHLSQGLAALAGTTLGEGAKT